MAVVERAETYDVRTKARGEIFHISFDENPGFEDRATAERAAKEINEVLERLGG